MARTLQKIFTPTEPEPPWLVSHFLPTVFIEIQPQGLYFIFPIFGLEKNEKIEPYHFNRAPGGLFESDPSTNCEVILDYLWQRILHFLDARNISAKFYLENFFCTFSGCKNEKNRALSEIQPLGLYFNGVVFR